MAEVKKGDKFTAGGTAKVFEVQSVSKDIVTLKEDVKARPPEEQPEAEVVSARVEDLLDSDDWIGLE